MQGNEIPHMHASAAHHGASQIFISYNQGRIRGGTMPGRPWERTNERRIHFTWTGEVEDLDGDSQSAAVPTTRVSGHPQQL